MSKIYPISTEQLRNLSFLGSEYIVGKLIEERGDRITILISNILSQRTSLVEPNLQIIEVKRKNIISYEKSDSDNFLFVLKPSQEERCENNLENAQLTEIKSWDGSSRDLEHFPPRVSEVDPSNSKWWYFPKVNEEQFVSSNIRPGRLEQLDAGEYIFRWTYEVNMGSNGCIDPYGIEPIGVWISIGYGQRIEDDHMRASDVCDNLENNKYLNRQSVYFELNSRTSNVISKLVLWRSARQFVPKELRVKKVSLLKID